MHSDHGLVWQDGRRTLAYALGGDTGLRAEDLPAALTPYSFDLRPVEATLTYASRLGSPWELERADIQARRIRKDGTVNPSARLHQFRLPPEPEPGSLPDWCTELLTSHQFPPPIAEHSPPSVPATPPLASGQ